MGWACILSDRYICCTLKGGRTTAGYTCNAPGAFFVSLSFTVVSRIEWTPRFMFLHVVCMEEALQIWINSLTHPPTPQIVVDTAVEVG